MKADPVDPMDLALEILRKKHGPTVVMKLSDTPEIQAEIISTGVLGLDRAMGVGGLPLGRVIEVYGPESAGKTTLALTIVAHAQLQTDKDCLYIDAEHSLDAVYAEAIGVNMDRFWIHQPDYGEQGLEVIQTMAETGRFAIVVVDSIPGMTPRAEIEGDYGDSHVGLQPRMWGQAMRKLVGVCDRTNTMLLLINQLRDKIGVIYGSPENLPGGRAIKFFKSVSLDVRRIETQKTDGEAVGNRTKVTVRKNKVGAPLRTVEFDIIFGKGISIVGDLLDAGVDCGVVKKSGAWFSWEDTKLGQGRVAAITYLEDNPELTDHIRSQVVENLGI